jgi:gluconokinase
MVAVEPGTTILVVMGVAGSGKTTIGSRLAEVLGWEFAEGDSFHSTANVEKMARGEPLDDADRWPWLDAIGAWVRARVDAGRCAVVACSALKRSYRDRLRSAWPLLRIVYLDADRDMLMSRLAHRPQHFFPQRLLGSQLRDLEPPAADERPIVVTATDSADAIVRAVVAKLHAEGIAG